MSPLLSVNPCPSSYATQIYDGTQPLALDPETCESAESLSDNYRQGYLQWIQSVKQSAQDDSTPAYSVDSFLVKTPGKLTMWVATSYHRFTMTHMPSLDCSVSRHLQLAGYGAGRTESIGKYVHPQGVPPRNERCCMG